MLNLKCLVLFAIQCVITLLSGEIAKVDGTLFDLRKPVTLKDRLPQISGPPVGYDHNFCLGKPEIGRTLAARVEHEASGRVLEVWTDQPGIQFYTGNFLDGLPGKNGATYGQHSAFALETQNFPDAINHVSIKSLNSFGDFPFAFRKINYPMHAG